MTQPSLEELFRVIFGKLTSPACPMCDCKMTFGTWKGIRLFVCRGCADPIDYYGVTIGEDGQCSFRGTDCTYDELLRMCKMKELL
jgi:hypothetical protein